MKLLFTYLSVAVLASAGTILAAARSCGEWPNKDCSADKRYNPFVSSKLKRNNAIWKGYQGLWRAEIRAEQRDGRDQEPVFATENLPGTSVPYDRSDYVAFYNNTIRGTKFYQHVHFIYKAAPEWFCKLTLPDNATNVLGKSECGKNGMVTFGSNYGTATHEKDGTVNIFKSTGVFKNYGKARFIPVDDQTIYSSFMDAGKALDATTLVFTNPEQTRMAGTGNFLLLGTTENTIESSYRIELTQVTKDNFMNGIASTYTQANVLDVDEIPTELADDCMNEADCPSAELWAANDPVSASNPTPYQEEPQVKPAVIAGFTVLGVFILVLALVVCHFWRLKKQSERYKHTFARRIAQTIRLEGSHELLTPEALADEFKRIDTDGNGHITKEELRAFISSGKMGTMSDSDFNALFAAMDVDHGGTVEFAEFCAFLSSCGDVYDEEERKLTKEERLKKAARRLSQSLQGSSPGDTAAADAAAAAKAAEAEEEA